MSVSQDRRDGVMRYQMREKLLSIGEDYWIQNAEGERVLKVDGKTLRIRDTFVLEAPDGEELFTIEKKLLSIRSQMEIQRAGKIVATVKKALFNPLRDHFSIEVDGAEPMEAAGNIGHYAYDIERGGEKVAEVSKDWFSMGDAYGVEIAAGQDDALMLAVTVCIDHMTHED
jgi:uncharacterized protein YxjI